MLQESRSGHLRFGREIPSLYGIRGVAAMSVVLYHLKVPGFSGPFAVICFFVLSGFLITHLLLREQDRTGTISLLGFYRRRAFRILPAFFGFIAVYVVARLLLHLPIDWETIGWSVAYLNNYHYGAHALNHCWSLSVEEQFYALARRVPLFRDPPTHACVPCGVRDRCRSLPLDRRDRRFQQRLRVRRV